MYTNFLLFFLTAIAVKNVEMLKGDGRGRFFSFPAKYG